MNEVESKTKTKPDNNNFGIKRNLISGFVATGIVPLNPNKVLDKIPGGSDYNPSTEINECLTELLREKRYGNTTERIRRKKQRLNVVPGRSVSTNENEENEEDEYDHIEEEVETEEEENIADTEEVDYVEPQIGLLLPETFVLVKFMSGRKRNCTTFQYVCRIVEKFSDDEVTVVGLKSSNDRKTKFKLVQSDLSTVPVSDIVAVLPIPEVEDGEYVFINRVDVREL